MLRTSILIWAFRRYRPWFVGGLVGGIVGALVVDLAPQILPTEMGFRARECRDLLDEERATGWTQYRQSGVCVTLLHPRPQDADLVLDSEPDLQGREHSRRVVAGMEALRDSGTGGDVRVRFLVDTEGAVSDPGVADSAGDPVLDALALEIVDGMWFTPGRNGDPATPVRMEFSIAARVRS